MRRKTTGLAVLIATLALSADERLEVFHKMSVEVPNEGRTYSVAGGSLLAGELVTTGSSLWSVLFDYGWPTTPRFRQFLRRADELGSYQIEALHFWSGAGVTADRAPLVLEHYRELTSPKPKPFAAEWKGPEDFLRWKFKALADKVVMTQAIDGLGLTHLPVARATPHLLQPFNPRDGLSLRWDLTGSAKHRIEPAALGLSLWSQTLYARRMLGSTRQESRTKSYFGAQPHEGFFGLLACYNMSNVVTGLNHPDLPLLSDGSNLRLAALQSYDPFKQFFYFPHGVDAAILAQPGKYDPTIADGTSLLADHSAILLGLSELLLFVAQPELAEAFDMKDGEKSVMTQSVIDQAHFLSNLAFRNMVDAHFDAGVGSFDGKWTGVRLPGSRSSELDLRDGALALVALGRYREVARASSNATVSANLEQIETFLRLQTEFMAKLQNPDGTFPLSVDLGSERAIDTAFSLELHGLMLQGLVEAHRALGPKNPALQKQIAEMLEKLLAALDDRWMPRLKLFFAGEAKKDHCVYRDRDMAAIIGGLRRYAVEMRDIRAFYRLIDVLEGLESLGLIRSSYPPDFKGAQPRADGGNFGAAPVSFSEVFCRFKSMD